MSSITSKLATLFYNQNLGHDYLERIIIMSKGSVERAKHRLDKLCTLRCLMPQYFYDYDVMKDFSNVKGVFTYCALPKLTNDHERIMIIKGSGRSLRNETLTEGYRYCAMMVEYFKAHDYASSYIIVNDIRAVNMSELISKIDIVELRQMATLITDGYGLRIKGIHFLTESKLVDILVSLIKQVVKENVGKRLWVHTSMDSLYTAIPKQILPIEYGGGECSIDELYEKWEHSLSTEEFRNHWRQMNGARTDETRRQTDEFNKQYMGVPGTFRQLSVD